MGLITEVSSFRLREIRFEKKYATGYIYTGTVTVTWLGAAPTTPKSSQHRKELLVCEGSIAKIP